MTLRHPTILGATMGLTLLMVGGAVPAAQAPVQTAELTERGLGPDDFPRITELAENVYAYEDVHVQGAITTNSLIVVTADGVLVADGQGRPDQVERLVNDIANLTDQPIRYVVVGSHHGDHTGGYEAFPEGVTFIAHPTSQAALDIPAEAVTDSRVLSLGGTQIDILHIGRAHTGGDLVVHVPSAGVLFMSESFLHRMFPSVAGGYPSEWIEAIREAERMNADVYVPGHGFVDDRATLGRELTLFRQALETVVAEGTRLHAAGVPVEDALAQADLGEFAGWSISELMAPRALARVYAELDGQLD
jgi:cyclase